MRFVEMCQQYKYIKVALVIACKYTCASFGDVFLACDGYLGSRHKEQPLCPVAHNLVHKGVALFTGPEFVGPLHPQPDDHKQKQFCPHVRLK